MSQATTHKRLATKTPEASFLNTLQQEFNFSLRVSRELLITAQEMLLGNIPAAAVRPGQVRQVVASMKAPFGPPLAEADKVEVTLMVDAGNEDAEVKAQTRSEGLRRPQIPRLTEEAITALQGWLDSLRKWKRNGSWEHNEGDFMAAFRRITEFMGSEWADANPCDIDKLAAVVQGEELPEERPSPWTGWSDSDREWVLGQIEFD